MTHTPVRPARPRTMLRDPSYRLLWTARTVSQTGDAMCLVALPFAVLEVGGHTSQIGYVMAAATLPRLLLLLAGGVWVDRLPRRLVMITADAAQVLGYAVTALILITGHGSVTSLALTNAVAGIASAFFRPALSAIVPEVVAEDRRQHANAGLSLGRSLSGVAGPALAGLLVAGAGAGYVFAVNAATFAASGLCLCFVRTTPAERAPRGTFLADLRDGWRTLNGTRWYLANILAHGMWNFAITPFYVLGPVISQRHLGGSAAWSAVSIASAVGAALGSFTVLRVRPRRPLVAANLALVPAAFQLLALIGPAHVAVVCAAALLGSYGLGFLTNIWDTSVQRLIPQASLARVSSYDSLVSFAAAPLGMSLCGAAAESVGAGPTLAVAAVVLALPCVLVALLPGVRSVTAGQAPA